MHTNGASNVVCCAPTRLPVEVRLAWSYGSPLEGAISKNDLELMPSEIGTAIGLDTLD